MKESLQSNTSHRCLNIVFLFKKSNSVDHTASQTQLILLFPLNKRRFRVFDGHLLCDNPVVLNFRQQFVHAIQVLPVQVENDACVHRLVGSGK